jgi:beta-lactamase regulating signal transducer with metallopeptidase domain
MKIMTASRSAYQASTGLLILAMICVGTFSLCGWLVAWCLHGAYLKQDFLGMVLLSIGTLTVLKQIWKTRHYTKSILCSATADFPYHVQRQFNQLGIDSSKVVLVQSVEPLAFCFDFLKPRICLSTGLIDVLSSSQLQAVLLHEDYHRQRRDPLRMLAVKSIGAALFFLPFIQEWCRIFEIKLELDADRYAVQRTSRSALAGALHQLLKYSPRTFSISHTGVITSRLSANSARIAALLGDRSKSERISIKSLISSTAILWIICLLLMI